MFLGYRTGYINHFLSIFFLRRVSLCSEPATIFIFSSSFPDCSVWSCDCLLVPHGTDALSCCACCFGSLWTPTTTKVIWAECTVMWVLMMSERRNVLFDKKFLPSVCFYSFIATCSFNSYLLICPQDRFSLFCLAVGKLDVLQNCRAVNHAIQRVIFLFPAT